MVFDRVYLYLRLYGEYIICVGLMVWFVVQFLVQEEIVGSSYMIESARKCAMTCVSKKGPMYGLKVWYILAFGIAKIVTIAGLFFAVSSAKWIA